VTRLAMISVMAMAPQNLAPRRKLGHEKAKGFPTSPGLNRV
jgi:hypothetical protein